MTFTTFGVKDRQISVLILPLFNQCIYIERVWTGGTVFFSFVTNSSSHITIPYNEERDRKFKARMKLMHNIYQIASYNINTMYFVH